MWKAWFSDLNHIKSPANTPGYCDAIWPDTWPLSANMPPADLYYGQVTNFMGRICIDRHSMAINVSFVDGHVDRVPLPRLWMLKWSNFFQPTPGIVIP